MKKIPCPCGKCVHREETIESRDCHICANPLEIGYPRFKLLIKSKPILEKEFSLGRVKYVKR